VPTTPVAGTATVDAPLAFWFFRHAEIPSHRGDLPATSAGLDRAETVGATLVDSCPPGSHVEFLHAPTIRTVQTAEALRRGVARGLSARSGVRLGAPRVERAVRNPDLYVAGHRVEMVSSMDAVAAQLPDDALTRADDDPPGERADEVAWRFFSWARSLLDTARPYARRCVCVTHSGPMRALLRRYVLGHDPGEPEYVEAVELSFDGDGRARWRFRETVAGAAAA
jgi:broad specificity phosphatase PhoE